MRIILITILLLASFCAQADTAKKQKAEALAAFGKWVVVKGTDGLCIAFYDKKINIHMHSDDLVIMNKEGVTFYDYKLDDGASKARRAAKIEQEFGIVRFANNDLKNILSSKKLSIEIANDMNLTNYYEVDLTEAWVTNSYLNSEHCS